MARLSFFDNMRKLNHVYNETSIDDIDTDLVSLNDYMYAKRVANMLITFVIESGANSSNLAKAICVNWNASFEDLCNSLRGITGKCRSEKTIRVLRSRISSQFFSIFGADVFRYFDLYKMDKGGITKVKDTIVALSVSMPDSFSSYLPMRLQGQISRTPDRMYSVEELGNELIFVRLLLSINIEAMLSEGNVDIDKLRYINFMLKHRIFSTTQEKINDDNMAPMIELRKRLMETPLVLSNNAIKQDKATVSEDITIKDYLGIEPLSESDIVDLLKASMGYDFGSQERMNQPNNDEAVNKFVNTLGLILSPQGIVSVLNRTHPDVIRKGIDIMRKTIESAKRNE